MNSEEFRQAYIEAQNGLGNELQTLISLSSTLTEIANSLGAIAHTIQTDYARMNQVVEQYLNDQDNQL